MMASMTILSNNSWKMRNLMEKVYFLFISHYYTLLLNICIFEYVQPSSNSNFILPETVE